MAVAATSAAEWRAAVAEAEWRIDVPAFMDCGEEGHEDWARFRELWRAAPRQPLPEDPSGDPPFPLFEPLLAQEAQRLYEKWRGKLATWNEDYPPGAADFYHSCHFGERTDYCLYGHMAALAYLARYVEPAQRHDIARSAMRLIGWTHCLDYLESSNWGFSLLALWDEVGGYMYPQVTLLHQHLQIGEGAGSGPALAGAAPAEAGEDGRRYFWIFELGIHKALSNEPVSMLESVLPDHTILHINYVKPYEGRAEAFRHPFPQNCSPNCKYQQESVPYTFPVFDDMAESARNFREFMLRTELRKPAVQKSSVFLCTNPIYYCSFFAGLNRTTIGYFGLPLMYMVPRDDWNAWVLDYVELAQSPQNLFLANNPLLAQQILWQSGQHIRVVSPVSLYVEVSYYPTRTHDVLVPEPREACVLNCLLRRFTPDGYPLRFFQKADTDRTLKTFSTFRSVVIYPHDYALMTFYEFYAMAMPLFMPSHLSKYLFPYSATVPLLDWAPAWLRAQDAEVRPSTSPLSLTSAAALRHWSKYIDFFSFPGVQLFPSVAALLRMLPGADLHGISARMREHRLQQLLEASRVWRAASQLAAG